MDLRETPAEKQLRQLQSVLDQGKQAQEEKRLDDAVRIYQSIIAEKLLDTSSDDLSKIKEEAIYRLGNIYAEQQKPEALAQLNRDIRPFFKDLPKAKTAKIVRTIIELVGKIPNTLQTQIDVCKESIEWCNREKRNFLRQRIETRLAELYFEKKEFQNALSLIEKLVKEVRRLDDKALLVEILLLESHVHHSLRNLGKSKASLTGARSAANAIYCPPLLQAEIDMQSGILHAEEKDYKTGYSYFFEAFEGFNNMDSRSQATKCLKYMILCKIMNNQTEDVQVLLSSKSALKFGGDDVEAMRGIANAYSARSLHQFEDVLRQYEPQLKGDLTINTHLQELYDSLLESHLARIIEPFSRVEISHVAKLINLPRDRIERKLSQMILDERLNGILDQGQDCIVLFDEKKQDELYPAALQTIDNLNTVVDSLFDRIRQELAAK